MWMNSIFPTLSLLQNTNHSLCTLWSVTSMFCVHQTMLIPNYDGRSRSLSHTISFILKVSPVSNYEYTEANTFHNHLYIQHHMFNKIWCKSMRVEVVSQHATLPGYKYIDSVQKTKSASNTPHHKHGFLRLDVIRTLSETVAMRTVMKN